MKEKTLIDTFLFYLDELFFYIFEFLPELFQVRLEALHLHGPPLLQRLVTLSHQLKTLGHFVWTLLHTKVYSVQNNSDNKTGDCHKIHTSVWWFYRHKHQYNSGTLNISLPTSPSSLICDSSVSRVIHCSLYISARRWACFRSSCNAWWNRVTQTGSLKNCNKHPKTKRDLILYIMGRWFFSVFHNTDFFKTTSIYMFFCFR